MDNRFKIYDYIDNRMRNIMQKWAESLSLSQKERAKIDMKIDMLESTGSDLAPGLLQDTKIKHIKEIAINGHRALRPLLCRGPIDMQVEFTLLSGAIEKDRKYIPTDALQKADNNRNNLLNGTGGRCEHERFKK